MAGAIRGKLVHRNGKAITSINRFLKLALYSRCYPATRLCDMLDVSERPA